MTERRRFFPARSVQQVQGSTVDLSLRLKPLANASAPATTGGAGGGDGVGLAILLEPWDFSATREFTNRTYDDWRVVAGDVPINGELSQPFRAINVGGSSLVEWDWDLDTSHMSGSVDVDWGWSGVTVEVQDGTALVTVGSGWVLDETFRYAMLTLAATLNGESLGVVTLRIGFNFWNE